MSTAGILQPCSPTSEVGSLQKMKQIKVNQKVNQTNIELQNHVGTSKVCKRVLRDQCWIIY